MSGEDNRGKELRELLGKLYTVRVSNLSGAADHDVVAVAVSDAQDVGGYTVACTRQSELLDGPLESITVDTKHTHRGGIQAHLFSGFSSEKTSSVFPNDRKSVSFFWTFGPQGSFLTQSSSL